MDSAKRNEKDNPTDPSSGGHSGRPPRIDGQYIRNQIGSVLSLDRGVFYTIKVLTLRPGDSIRHFILEDRTRLVKPVIFVIFSSFIYTLVGVTSFMGQDYLRDGMDVERSTAMTLIKWIDTNFGYLNIVGAFCMAFWAKLLFRRNGYNFYEILIVLLFMTGMEMLIGSLFGFISWIAGISLTAVGISIGFLYGCWVIGQFFEAKKVMSYLKGFLAQLLGTATFMLLITIAVMISRYYGLG